MQLQQKQVGSLATASIVYRKSIGKGGRGLRTWKGVETDKKGRGRGGQKKREEKKNLVRNTWEQRDKEEEERGERVAWVAQQSHLAAGGDVSCC